MLRARFIRAADAFHREERASISFLAIAGFICFVALLAMVINTNDMITERVHMQDVADVTALSASSWSARGLNMVSFINVLNSKLIATAVLLNALNDTIPVIIAIAKVQKGIFAACGKVWLTAAFCIPMEIVVTFQLQVLTKLKPQIERLARQLSRCDTGGKLWTMMTSLDKVAGGVQKSFVIIGLTEGYDIAIANGASMGWVMNGELKPKEGLVLPLKQEAFKEFCPKVMRGGPGYEMQGYQCEDGKRGPLDLGESRINRSILLPFSNLFPQPVFMGMVKRHYKQIGCNNHNRKGSDKVTVQLQDLAECKKHDVAATWAHVWGITRELDDNSLKLNHFTPWQPKPDNAKIDEDQKGEEDVTDISGLGDFNDVDITDLPDNVPGKPKVTLGKHVADIVDEYTPWGKEVPCDGLLYPSYAPPLGGWDKPYGGTVKTHPLQCGQNCQRIDKFKEFTWFSGEHIKGGAKNIGGYFIRVSPPIKIEPEKDGGKTKYRYVVEAVMMASAGEKAMTPAQQKKYLASHGQKNVNTEGNAKQASGCRDDQKPSPWMLDRGTSKQDEEDFQNRLRFISFVYKNLDDSPFWTTFFDSPPKRVMAYGQAQVYNYLAEDTFTQDWRVRLERASLLQDFVGKIPIPGFDFAAKGVDMVNNH